MKRPPKLLTSEAKQKRARRWRLIERSFSMAAIVVVLFLGWSAIDGMRRLFSVNLTQAISSNPSDIREAQLRVTDLKTALGNGGFWQIADWQWDVGVVIVTPDKMERRLEQLSQCELPSDLADRDRNAIRQLISALRQLPVKRISRDDRNEYRIDQAGTKLRVTTIGTGENEMLTSVGAALHNSESNQWTLFELRSKPQRHLTRSESAAIEHLLPLPATSRRLCGRTDEVGHIIFEVVEPAVQLSTLVAQWKQQGWDVQPFRPQRFGDRDLDYRNDYRPSTRFLCEKQNELVHIWKIPSEQSNSAPLAMMRISKDHFNASIASQKVDP